MHNVTDVRILK